MEYSISQFEADIQKVGPRPFDQYILPVFLLGYAVRSKKPMGKIARRILFTAGVYMFYRNYVEYKRVIAQITGRGAGTGAITAPIPSEGGPNAPA